MADEELLTTEDIQEIITRSVNYPIFKHPIMQFSPTYKTILGRSPKKGLIMVYGNDDTGYIHINKRHSYHYKYTQWKKDYPDQLDVPTSFPESEIFFLNWQSIVDEVYDRHNLNHEKNKASDLFDLYIGNYFVENERHSCFLLLYKNTKIIHTFYLVLKNKKYNRPKPKGFQHTKGEIDHLLDPENDFEQIQIPYFNSEKEMIFQVEAKRTISTGEETWILKFWKEGIPFKRLLRSTITSEMLERRLEYYDLAGLDHIEKEIGKINRMSIEELLKRTK